MLLFYIFAGSDVPKYPVQDHHQHNIPHRSTLSNGSSSGAGRAGKMEVEVSENGVGGEDLSKKIVRGSYQSVRSQPCQCSACIGAVATIVCPVSAIKI